MPYEYGYRDTENDEIQWPDDEGDLSVYVDQSPRQIGYVRCDGHHGPTDLSDEEIAMLQRRADRDGRELVRREVGPIEVVPRG